MIPYEITYFREIWCADFEFSAAEGELPKPICLVAKEMRSGRVWHLWEDDLAHLNSPPYSLGEDNLFVAYYAPAELGCHLALGWALPTHILDLYTEFRNLTNGGSTPCGVSLLGALSYFGLDVMEAIEKEDMRELALRGGPYTSEEQSALLGYCERDVKALCQLLIEMRPEVDLPRALHRGRYMKAVARMERNGIPIDTGLYQPLQDQWPNIQGKLIREIDSQYGVYEGSSFKLHRFETYLFRQGIFWPRLESGRLALDDKTFREMARSHPEIAPLRELRVSLSQMHLADLSVGTDGRNRVMLSPFSSKTGRNQPSNSRFIFGPAKWLRGLIRPGQGCGLAYIDWAQQELGVAAGLSRDPAMMEAYRSGDPYLSFAKQAGAVPSNATKATHPVERELFKACSLGVLYGMGARSLALRIKRPEIEARELLRKHHETSPVFWRWSDAAKDYANLYGKIGTVFGWEIHVGAESNPRSLLNFPMQANGAEMLRLTCCFATERGIRVCAPIHDALLIEAPLEELDEAVLATEEAMVEASRAVLGGFELRTDKKIIRHPDRYRDQRGEKMWDTVLRILDELGVTTCATGAQVTCSRV